MAIAWFEVLSEPLVTIILSKLPPASLAIARCVCTSWNQIVTSQPPSKSPPPWCFLLTRLKRYESQDASIVAPSFLVSVKDSLKSAPSCWVYNPLDSKWFRVMAPEDPGMGFLGSRNQLCPIDVTASAGLIAFRTRWRGYKCLVFWVGNPLTNKWRIIPFSTPPDTEEWSDSDAQLVFDESRQCYKLVVFSCAPPLGSDTLDVVWTTHIYHSASRAWTAGASILEKPPILSGRASCYFEGVVYILQWVHEHGKKIQVLAYHVEREEFSVAFPAAPIRSSFTPAMLLTACVHLTVRREEETLVLEFLGALSSEPEHKAELETFCVFKYEATKACWMGYEKRQSRIRDFCPETVSFIDIWNNSCGQAGISYLSPNCSKLSGGLFLYDSTKAQGTYMVHPVPISECNLDDTYGERSSHRRLTEVEEGLYALGVASCTTSIGSFIPRLDVEP